MPLKDREYERFLAEARAEMDSVIAAAKRKFEERKAGLEWIKGRSSTSNGSSEKGDLERGEMTRAIKEAIELTVGNFTIKDIRATLAGKGILPTDSTLSSRFKKLIDKMRESHLVVQIAEGSGKNPATFKRAIRAVGPAYRPTTKPSPLPTFDPVPQDKDDVPF